MSEPKIVAMEPRSGLDRLADAAARRPVGEGRSPDALVREALVVGRARVRTAARRRATLVTMGALAATMLLRPVWLMVAPFA